jgi:hypothetical protein
MTAQEIADRIRKNRPDWKTSSADGFCAGDAGVTVAGIATTFAPTIDVLRRAAAGGKNLIVSRELPFWGRPSTAAMMARNPTFLAKQEFIAKNNLVIFRFRDNWDGQQAALEKALGWNAGRPAGTTLESLSKSIGARLKLHAVRVIGDAKLPVRRAALSHGMITVPEMRKILEDTSLHAVVIGEPVEWEASPYFMDAIASGRKIGLVVLGQQASEEPGSGEMAEWLKSIVPEVPVEWIPAGEPFTPGRWS